MIPLALALRSGLSTGPDLDLDTVTLQQAAVFDGQVVRATVNVMNPPDAVGRWTVAGDDRGAITRTVVPKDPGVSRDDSVTVVGVLEVIRHPAAVVNGVQVPGWDEVRVRRHQRGRPFVGLSEKGKVTIGRLVMQGWLRKLRGG